MGSAADPWRVAQARHRNRADECGQVYGQAARPAVPRMEDIPPQSRRRHRRDGSVRRADNLVSSALWTADRGARPTTDRIARRHSASDRRMDCKSDHGSMRLGTSSPLSDPRSRSGLWQCLHPTASIDGHSRPTNVATLPVAKWICRTADRFDPTRECLDHVVVFGERHPRHVLLSYLKYYNEMRTHLSLEKDAPVSRAVERAGSILCRPVLGGLHHQYVRI